jgi:hypothetical protein
MADRFQQHSRVVRRSEARDDIFMFHRRTVRRIGVFDESAAPFLKAKTAFYSHLSVAGRTCTDECRLIAELRVISATGPQREKCVPPGLSAAEKLRTDAGRALA